MQTWLHISTAIEVLSLMKKWKWSCVCLAHAYHGQWNCISACSKWKFVCHSMWEDVLCLRAWTSWFFISFCSSRLQSLPLGAFCLTCLWNAWLRLEHVAPRTLRQSWVIVVFSLVFFWWFTTMVVAQTHSESVQETGGTCVTSKRVNVMLSLNLWF